MSQEKLVIENYQNGNPYRQYYVNDIGEKHGLYKEFDINNNLQIYAHYQNNLLHGIYINYNDQGQIYKKCYYMNGKLTGLYEEFDTIDQHLIKRCNYNNNQLFGPYEEFNPDGSIKKSYFITS